METKEHKHILFGGNNFCLQIRILFLHQLFFELVELQGSMTQFHFCKERERTGQVEKPKK